MLWVLDALHYYQKVVKGHCKEQKAGLHNNLDHKSRHNNSCNKTRVPSYLGPWVCNKQSRVLAVVDLFAQDGAWLVAHLSGVVGQKNLKQQNPNLKIITIATVSQKDISKLDVENYNKATFIIVIDEDVTKTY